STAPPPKPPPPYPRRWGFGFKNKNLSAYSFGHFMDVYGDEAKLCVWGHCAGVDPIYAAVYYPLFLGLRTRLTGECFGMSAMSTLFYDGDRDVKDYNHAYKYPFDFKTWDSSTRKSLKNDILIAASKQLSREYLLEYLKDEAARNPIGRMNEAMHGHIILCMKNEFDIGGHCVTPYKVEETATEGIIHVYDNNSPRNSNVKILIDKGANTFDYQPDGISDDGRKQGRRIQSYPVSFQTADSLHFPIDGMDMISALFMGDVDFDELASSNSNEAEGIIYNHFSLSHIEGETTKPTTLVRWDKDTAVLKPRFTGSEAVFGVSFNDVTYSMELDDAVEGGQDQFTVTANASGDIEHSNYRPESSLQQFRTRIGFKPSLTESMAFS
ncbi:MAG: hypothetical protein MJA83_01485, partial [Gammaproteobacteria bacterium]|nr:hypothetical protein [Gammaproteobacteria bacterium]